MNRILYTLAVAILFATSALAKIIRVPADQPTIQAAINAAAKGDTVLVADGTYYENIDFKGKAITVASHFLVDGDTTHIDNAIIDGSKSSNPNKSSVVSFVSGEDTTSVIYGFTITGGKGSLYANWLKTGGGICVFSSGARVSHNKIVFNRVTALANQPCIGGGIGAWPQQNLRLTIIENNNIESNSLTSGNGANGGGIFLIQGRIVHNKISQNSCFSDLPAAFGGGISMKCDPAFVRPLVKIVGNIITDNQATSAQGPAVGGGIDVQLSIVHLVGNQITHNKISGAYPLHGAGARLYSNNNSIVKDNDFSFNTAVNGDGGGLLVAEAVDLTIQGNRFRGNTGRYGAGIYITNSNSVITNNLFFENKAEWAGGIGVTAETAGKFTARIINNTLTNNVADTTGGIGLYYADAVVMNTILWGNKARGAPEIGAWGGSAHVAYSDVRLGIDSIIVAEGGEVNWLGVNIDADPQLSDSLTLLASSPCLRAGIDRMEINGKWHYCPAIDLKGNPRPSPIGSRPDLGAIESPGPTKVEFLNSSKMPETFSLSQNYPNPFWSGVTSPARSGGNLSTVISYQLPVASEVELSIYNLFGQKVTTLVSTKQPAGRYKAEWNASGFTSGVYFYQLRTDKFVQTKKMILLQ